MTNESCIDECCHHHVADEETFTCYDEPIACEAQHSIGEERLCLLHAVMSVPGCEGTDVETVRGTQTQHDAFIVAVGGREYFCLARTVAHADGSDVLFDIRSVPRT